jgi:hypothetical protein
MKSLLLNLPLVADVSKIATDDYVGFTFFVGCMAMMAASAFFFLSTKKVTLGRTLVTGSSS